MSATQIIDSWKKQSFKPIYWLEGEEAFFIDQVVNYAEHHILSESEAGFNLTVFYGKDADWAAIINACRRYPMFAEKQVVVLKEAQQMKDIAQLEGYIENPMPSTILVVSYKDKKVDARTKLAKALKKNGEILTTKKLYENQLPDWITSACQAKGYNITPKAVRLIADFIGNDLSRISNEINKITVNLTNDKNITEDTVENYIGISKDFNVFELQIALANKDLYKAIRIIQYFAANPKAGPLQMVLPTLYNFFSKVYMIFGVKSQDSKAIATATGIHPFFVKDYITAAKGYGYAGTEKTLLLLHEYNLRGIGVGDAGTEDTELMKELVLKMLS